MGIAFEVFLQAFAGNKIVMGITLGISSLLFVWIVWALLFGDCNALTKAKEEKK